MVDTVAERRLRPVCRVAATCRQCARLANRDCLVLSRGRLACADCYPTPAKRIEARRRLRFARRSERPISPRLVLVAAVLFAAILCWTSIVATGAAAAVVTTATPQRGLGGSPGYAETTPRPSPTAPRLHPSPLRCPGPFLQEAAVRAADGNPVIYDDRETGSGACLAGGDTPAAPLICVGPDAAKRQAAVDALCSYVKSASAGLEG